MKYYVALFFALTIGQFVAFLVFALAMSKDILPIEPGGAGMLIALCLAMFAGIAIPSALFGQDWSRTVPMQAMLLIILFFAAQDWEIMRGISQRNNEIGAIAASALALLLSSALTSCAIYLIEDKHASKEDAKRT